MPHHLPSRGVGGLVGKGQGRMGGDLFSPDSLPSFPTSELPPQPPMLTNSLARSPLARAVPHLGESLAPVSLGSNPSRVL